MKERFRRGFLAAWAAYMALFLVSGYDGLPSLVLQPFVACIPAVVFALAADLAGWPLRATRWKGPWDRLGRWTLLLPAAGAAMILFAGPLGVSRLVAGGDGERAREVLPLPYAMGAYFLCVFPFVNRPEKPGC